MSIANAMSIPSMIVKAVRSSLSGWWYGSICWLIDQNQTTTNATAQAATAGSNRTQISQPRREALEHSGAASGPSKSIRTSLTAVQAPMRGSWITAALTPGRLSSQREIAG